MADKDLTWLKASLASWLKRSDLADQFPDFIMFAETKMGEDLKARAMSASAVIELLPGNDFATLPADFKSIRSIGLSTGHALDYAPPASLIGSTAPGQPRLYSIIGNQLRLAPVPDTGYTVKLVYEQMIPPLTDDMPTNWLLSRSPNAYLFGALTFAQPFIFSEERVSLFQQMYNDAIAGINNSDWHAGDDLTVRSDVRGA